jgi:hypothetical protein
VENALSIIFSPYILKRGFAAVLIYPIATSIMLLDVSP